MDKEITDELTCTIINGRFNYIMKVDYHTITFDGASAAEYFEEHYEALGYEVIRLSEKDESD